MAKTIKTTTKISELIAQGEAARRQLGESHVALKAKLDLPSKLRESVKSEPKKWIGGSAVLGLVGSLILRSKKKPKMMASREKKGKKQKSLFMALLGFAYTAAKPAVKIYATKLLKDYFKHQLSRGSGLRSTRKVLPR